MTFLLNFLGLSGVVTAIANALASVVSALAPVLGTILHAIVNFAIWYAKKFVAGLKVIFDNLSTLAVILVIVIATGWYTRTTCPAPVPCKHNGVSVSKGQAGTKKPVTTPKTDWLPW